MHRPSPLLRLLALVVGVALLYPIGRLAFGSDIGESCTSDHGCRALWNSRCLTSAHDPRDRYCTRSCKSDGDCPSGWTCERATVIREAAMTDEIAVCAAPEPEPRAPPFLKEIEELLDAGPESERPLQRQKVSSIALELARRASQSGAPELARACYAIDIARFDCPDALRSAADARASLAKVPDERRPDLEITMKRLDAALAVLCP